MWRNEGSNPVRAIDMKVRDLVARAGLDAEILVMYDESEDELAIEPAEEGVIRVEPYEGIQRVIVDLRYAKNIYVDSDQ